MKPEQKLKCPSCPDAPIITEQPRGRVGTFTWTEYRIVCRCGLTQGTGYSQRENCMRAWLQEHFGADKTSDYKEWP